ncbi:ECF transporter S component [Mycetocola zhujimingii]|uniref:Acyl esterase n=1 Tax=Mycetocola zhujimingii TaxID=2079792 RepID=A0A2U1TG11_9MICO|nr:ECF transporter S component [Mycetocola zhujimingii]PWC07723.1 acyl esterase [Mycetocola zhujimingii]
MRNASTRLLLTCAAIGVAGGLVFVVSGYLNGLVSATAPVLYGSIVGVYFLPGVVAQSLLRRGGVALLTGLFAGLIAAAFSPQWFLRYLGAGLAIGLLQELPFLVSRYRYWRAWVFYLAAAIAGIIFGAGVYLTIGAEQFSANLSVVYFALFAVSPIFFTWLGRVIASRIDKTGVARGLQREVDRRPDAPGSVDAPVTSA